MIVGHFLHQLNYFGTERMLESLLKYRSPAFADQFVVSLADGPMRMEYEALGIKVYVLREEEAINELLGDADLINLHLLEQASTPRILFEKAKKPVVVTMQGYAAFQPDIADWFIASSHATYELQPDKTKCSVICNAIDLERYHGTRNINTEKKVITRIGRSEKFDETFWYAMTTILAGYPDSEEWLAGIEGISSARVRLLGVVSDLAGIFEESCIFVHTPPPYTGSLDLIVMEAMAAGMPCVLYDVPATRGSASNEQAVVFVPFGDAERLREAITTLLDNPAKAAQLGKSARDYAVSHFDVRARVLEYEQVYRRVIQ